MRALIDADVLVYRACFAVPMEFEDGVVAGEGAATKTAHLLVDEWREKANADSVVVCMSDRSRADASWRYRVFPKYKANRRDQEKPPFFATITAALEDREDTVIKPGLEADDLLGILHTKDPANTIMVTIDKDLLTVPGFLCNPDKEGPERFVSISENQATINWVRQALTGDRVDGYYGIRGIGPKKAGKIVPDGVPAQTAIRQAFRAFREAKMPTEEIYANFMCSYILRDTDYDSATGSIRINSPLTGEPWFAVKGADLKTKESNNG